MAEDPQDSETVKTETDVDSPASESQIKDAMRSRVSHFKQQADSLTFEGVRRLLEKDLGLQEYALDVHKRFVKQCLVECLEGAVDDNTSKDSGESGQKPTHLAKSEAEESTEGHESKADIKEPGSEDEEKMEDSPVMGLLTGKKAPKLETEGTPVNKKRELPSESGIKKALLKRASYIKANTEKITMAGLRRLLEEDLGLDKFALDPCKKLISKQLDEVLESSEVSEPKKKKIKNNPQTKASKKSRTKESSDTSDRESDDEEEEDEDEVKPKKKVVSKKKVPILEGSKKRKRPEKDIKVSSKKRSKPVEAVAEDNSDAEGSENASEDSHSQLPAEKPVKKKEASTPAYGKRVEHLKSIIKASGMSVPPVVYKKVKQVPENKRETQLIKELEELLSKEGLSSDPTEKEIKEVRKRKERAKELEGIDMSNIVSSSRRRSTTSYVPPPKPKLPIDTDSEEDDEDDDNGDEEEENVEEEDGDNDGDDGSQSEETNDDGGEDSN